MSSIAKSDYVNIKFEFDLTKSSLELFHSDQPLEYNPALENLFWCSDEKPGLHCSSQ